MSAIPPSCYGSRCSPSRLIQAHRNCNSQMRSVLQLHYSVIRRRDLQHNYPRELCTTQFRNCVLFYVIAQNSVFRHTAVSCHAQKHWMKKLSLRTPSTSAYRSLGPKLKLETGVLMSTSQALNARFTNFCERRRSDSQAHILRT
jgi:hypothetical protein